MSTRVESEEEIKVPIFPIGHRAADECRHAVRRHVVPQLVAGAGERAWGCYTLKIR